MPLGSLKGSAYPYVSTRAVVTNRRGIQRGGSLLYHQTWPAPSTAVNNDILTATAGPNTTTIIPALNGTLVTGGQATLLAALGPFTGGRNVVITVTHATAVVAVSGVITGLDVYGVRLTENWSVTAGGTSKTYTGAVAFKKVLSISITAVADASADTVIAGDGNLLGLDVVAEVPGAGASIKELVDGSLVTTGTIVAGGLSINSAGVISVPAAGAATDRRGTYSPATAPNGAHNYDLWYVSDIPEFSGGA